MGHYKTPSHLVSGMFKFFGLNPEQRDLPGKNTQASSTLMTEKPQLRTLKS
jgi:hypothetical protein